MSDEGNNSAPVPESVQALSGQIDGQIAARIYVDLRWKLKTQDLDFEGIAALIDAAIKRVRKECSGGEVTDQAIAHLEAMKQTFREIKTRRSEFPGMEERPGFIVGNCPICSLPAHLCACEDPLCPKN